MHKFVPNLLLRNSSRSHILKYYSTMKLKTVVNCIESFAPPSLAGSWDNVGLLIEPSDPLKDVKEIMLTNDLTEPVMAECVEKGVDMIISYHPPIFRPLKRLTSKSWKERVVVSCVENKIALYSPHTSLDAVLGGVNDWLIAPFGRGKVQPLEQSVNLKHDQGYSHLVTFNGVVEKPFLENVLVDDTGISCSTQALPQVIAALDERQICGIKVVKLEKKPLPGNGPGRLLSLDTPVTLADAVEKVKKHLQLQNLRLATGNQQNMDSMVNTVAGCAGSGGSVLAGCPANLWVTGEMSHHEALDAVHNGTSVILCEHSNTERGYLKEFAEKLTAMLDNQVMVSISERDKDPLVVV